MRSPRSAVIYDALLWWSYSRVERWKHIILRRVTFLGWFLLAMMVLSGALGSDVLRHGLGFVSCLCLLLGIVEIVSLCFRRNHFTTVENTATGVMHAGEEGLVSLQVTAGRKVKRCRIVLYPWLPPVSLSVFREAQEPGEEQRNIVDRGLKFYRWRWLNQQRAFSSTVSEELQLAPGESHLVTLPTQFHERGEWSLIDVRVQLSGVFGLLHRSVKTAGRRTEVAVAPALHPVYLGPQTGVGRAEADALLTRPTVGESHEFLSLRDYQPGDSWRKVNWKAMARTDKMMVQEDEDYAVPRYTLRWQTKGMSKVEFETAASAVASIALHMAQRGEGGSVQLHHGAGHKEYDWHTEREPLLQALARIQQDVPWPESPQPITRGLLYCLTKDTARDDHSVLLHVNEDCINSTPIQEGITL